MSNTHVHELQVYYEDTDFTGVVYHANYLRFFERAREHLLGQEHLVTLYDEHGIGFVVYKADLTYKEGAKHGDSLEIRSVPHLHSLYRIVFDQSVWRKDQDKPLVLGKVDLVCVDKNNKLVPLPEIVLQGMKERYGVELKS